MVKQQRRDRRSFEFDVCLSFAGEDRAYVRAVAEQLRSAGVRVFFDEYAQAEMWGKDLYTHLDDVYQNAARYCVVFVSRHYARRVWTNHERQSAQARAIREHREYLLPARFDGTRIPGLRPTVGYVDAAKLTPKQVASLIRAKIGDRPRERYFPPIPDRLFEQTRARSNRAKERAEWRARHFFAALERMEADERKLVLSTFMHSCAAEVPENVHASLDLLRRVTGFSESKIARLAGGLRSLGIYAQLRDDGHDGYLGASRTLVLEWHDFSTEPHITGNATGSALDMLKVASEAYCPDCAMPVLLRMDFSSLATATLEPHSHAPMRNRGRASIRRRVG